MPSRIRELRESIQRRTENLYDTLFTRRVSVYFTAMLAPLGVTPNQVSVLALLVALACCALIAFGSRPGVTVGAALVHLYAVLDSVDGELARLTKNFSLKGLFIEDISAYLMINAFNLAVAYYLFKTTGKLVPLGLAVAVAAFGRNAMPVARRAWLKSIATRRPVSADVHVGPQPARPRGRLARAFRVVIEENILHSMTIWIELSILILIEVLGGWEGRGLVLYGFYFFMASFLLKELAIYVHLLRGRRLEEELLRLYQNAAQGPDQAERVDVFDLAKY